MTIETRFETPTYGVGGVAWLVKSNDIQLVERIAKLYDGCARREDGAATVSFELLRAPGPDDAVTVSRDGIVVRDQVSSELAIAHLVWELNAALVGAPSEHLLLHAAAAELDGKVVVISGGSGAGKSTLVAALVGQGLAYMTDEIVAVDRDTGLVEPYAKPIVLERGSWAVVAGVATLPLDTLWGDALLVTPHDLRGAVARAPGRPRLVVLSSYEPGSASLPRRVTRAEAAIALCGESFNLRKHARGALEIVADLVRGCECYELVYGDGVTAATAVRTLLEQVDP